MLFFTLCNVIHTFSIEFLTFILQMLLPTPIRLPIIQEYYKKSDHTAAWNFSY